VPEATTSIDGNFLPTKIWTPQLTSESLFETACQCSASIPITDTCPSPFKHPLWRWSRWQWAIGSCQPNIIPSISLKPHPKESDDLESNNRSGLTPFTKIAASPPLSTSPIRNVPSFFVWQLRHHAARKLCYHWERRYQASELLAQSHSDNKQERRNDYQVVQRQNNEDPRSRPNYLDEKTPDDDHGRSYLCLLAYHLLYKCLLSSTRISKASYVINMVLGFILASTKSTPAPLNRLRQGAKWLIVAHYPSNNLVVTYKLLL